MQVRTRASQVNLIQLIQAANKRKLPWVTVEAITGTSRPTLRRIRRSLGLPIRPIRTA
jgi:hypothetical protein